MIRLNVQHKTKAKKGAVEMHWFENEFTGLKKTLFHRIIIPLTAFDSGLDYESQPIKTEIFIDWLALNLINPTDLDDLIISSKNYAQLEASIYIGGAHNWCDVIELKINRKSEEIYFVDGDLIIDFSAEGIAEKERFTFKTTIEFREVLA